MLEKNSLENSLTIIGDEDIVSGFKALGFSVYAVKELKEFIVILDEIVRQGTAVCLLQDNIYAAAEESIKSYRSQPLPVFVPFSKNEKTDLLESIVKDIRLKATGAY